MATKDEYYQKIIASQQAEITSLKSSISDLSSKIESIKSEIQESKKVTPVSDNRKANVESYSINSICQKVSDMCNKSIQRHYATLPDLFVEKSEFARVKTSINKKYLPTTEYAAQKKILDKRLKSIEDRIVNGFSLLAINLYTDKESQGHRSIFNDIKNMKGIEIEGCLPILVLLTIFSLAAYLIFTIE